MPRLSQSHLFFQGGTLAVDGLVSSILRSCWLLVCRYLLSILVFNPCRLFFPPSSSYRMHDYISNVAEAAYWPKVMYLMYPMYFMYYH